MGEFNGWKGQPMSKGSDGSWRVKVTLPAGTHGYKFLVNGSEWVLDPVNPKRKSVEGVENSAVEIGAGSAAAAPLVPTPAPITRTPMSITAPLTPSPTRTKTLVTATGTASTPAGPALVIRPGEVITVDVPLSASRRAEAGEGGNPSVTTAKVAIGVPRDFDPTRAWPILVISATSDASNIGLLGAYQREALDAGWIVLAADGPEKPKTDRTSWRLAMIGAALDYLAAQWPGSAAWPIAAGGYSGGAKRSGLVAAALAKDGRRVVGMFMGGCNQDLATEGLRDYRPPSTAFKQVPIFLSSGTTDTISTPAHHERVVHAMKGTGFRKVRLESFEGAHDIYPPHTTMALQWFLSEAAPAAPSPTPASSLDTFFKKP